MTMDNISDIAALRIWNSIIVRYPEKVISERVLWKLRCDDNGSRVYIITYKKNLGIQLNGKCVKCGHDVCRVIEE